MASPHLLVIGKPACSTSYALLTLSAPAQHYTSIYLQQLCDRLPLISQVMGYEKMYLELPLTLNVFLKEQLRPIDGPCCIVPYWI